MYKLNNSLSTIFYKTKPKRAWLFLALLALNEFFCLSFFKKPLDIASVEHP